MESGKGLLLVAGIANLAPVVLVYFNTLAHGVGAWGQVSNYKVLVIYKQSRMLCGYRLLRDCPAEQGVGL